MKAKAGDHSLGLASRSLVTFVVGGGLSGAGREGMEQAQAEPSVGINL